MKQVVACGGSWMAPQAMIAAGEFDKITAEVAKAVALAGGAKAA
jgi:2-keto-3-deoxy-6-phosphogluconate aldolase